MKLEGAGIIIEIKPFDDRDCTARIFTDAHGVLCGIFRGGLTAKTKPLLGQFGQVSWNARLESHLGQFHFENERNMTAGFFNTPDKLKFANACLALLATMLPERERYKRLWDETLILLTEANRDEYLKWELCLLAELGYGLSLERCGNCGRTADLQYISPKTGRAVCGTCGDGWRDKMFKMPADLGTTGHFLEQVRELPPARRII